MDEVMDWKIEKGLLDTWDESSSKAMKCARVKVELNAADLPYFPTCMKTVNGSSYKFTDPRFEWANKEEWQHIHEFIRLHVEHKGKGEITEKEWREGYRVLSLDEMVPEWAQTFFGFLDDETIERNGKYARVMGCNLYYAYAQRYLMYGDSASEGSVDDEPKEAEILLGKETAVLSEAELPYFPNFRMRANWNLKKPLSPPNSPSDCTLKMENLGIIRQFIRLHAEHKKSGVTAEEKKRGDGSIPWIVDQIPDWAIKFFADLEIDEIHSSRRCAYCLGCYHYEVYASTYLTKCYEGTIHHTNRGVNEYVEAMKALKKY